MKARENPFRSERIEGLSYRAEEFSWEALQTRLDLLGGRGALVGPEGHGKTTLLLQWRERRMALGESTTLVRVATGQRRLSQEQRCEVAEAEHLFLDSAEQLDWLGWREVCRINSPARTVIIAQHRAGRLPTLIRCRTSPALLADLVQELTGGEVETEELWRRHRGNVRLALRSLYDERAAG